MTEVKIDKCPYCGGEEFFEGPLATSDRKVTVATGIFSHVNLYASGCRNCGSVVRTFCKTPDKLPPTQ